MTTSWDWTDASTYVKQTPVKFYNIVPENPFLPLPHLSDVLNQVSKD